MLKFCVENFNNLEKSMSYAFSISHVGELSGQNRCASKTRNIESNTHGLRRNLSLEQDPGKIKTEISCSSMFMNEASFVKKKKSLF
jgi:hypothetical protein